MLLPGTMEVEVEDTVEAGADVTAGAMAEVVAAVKQPTNRLYPQFQCIFSRISNRVCSKQSLIRDIHRTLKKF